jgi:predicted ribosome quality control (RQC) complex YloA/Tae2 family protein
MAQARLTKVEKEFENIRQVEAVIATVTDPESWKEVRKTSRSLLERNASSTGASERAIPYRRFDIGSGFDVWVGRNAKQNDELTTRAARKFDIWLHARGVGGSHVLLRPPNRTAGVPEGLVLRAAAIAAYYSKARGSSLVPVVVAERKYVRKPRRAPPGTVLVDRHRVVMVEPGLPEQD